MTSTAAPTGWRAARTRSVPRYDLALFPSIIVIADLTARARLVRPLLVTGGAGLLIWGAFVFAEGGWIG